MSLKIGDNKMKATTTRKALVLGFVLSLTAATASAQSYYDDDIYYDADKAKKEKAEKAAKKRAEEDARQKYLESVVDNEAGSERNVDEYNRRKGYTPQKEQQADLGDNFTYTRRIEQFSNPGIVVNSNDDDLKYLYTYANDELAGATGSTSPTTINIYVDNTDPWNNFWSPYYYTSAWSRVWSPAYYNPWWGYNYWNYGPSWGWSWGYGPSWGWSWGYGPSWGWSWNPPRPPHHPATPSQPGHRPGNNAGYVPGGRGGRSGGRVTTPGAGHNASGVGRRPAGSSTQHYTPGQGSSHNYRPANGNVSNSGNVGTGNRRTGSGTVYGNSSYNNSGSTRSSSGSTRSSSGSSYNSGSRSSSGSSRSTSTGGTRSGGGGRSGGRR
ncbi:MAG: hypothetical protein NC301_00375 [Bacteroides sp.]|nr:hypothetical protein [Bacteroides sp.]MCM1379363.1 hypothetical protein [Bacteroides sp.]MCM1445223.1 hypothetical protein [Prevotella sp.]